MCGRHTKVLGITPQAHVTSSDGAVADSDL